MEYLALKKIYAMLMLRFYVVSPPELQGFYVLLYTYRDLRAKKHRDKSSHFALEKPADWSYNLFLLVKLTYRCSDGYIIIFTSEKNRIARTPLLLIDK